MEEEYRNSAFEHKKTDRSNAQWFDKYLINTPLKIHIIDNNIMMIKNGYKEILNNMSTIESSVLLDIIILISWSYMRLLRTVL